LSRFRILALFATVAVLAGVLAACGGSSDSSGEDPQKVVESATLKGVESGDLNFSLHVKSEGTEAGEVDVKLSGPFQKGAEGELPQLSMEASAKGEAEGEPLDFEGAFTLLSDRAFIGYEGTTYEVDPTTFGFAKSAVEQAEAQGGEESGAGVTACQKAAEGIEISQFVDNLKNDGSAEVEGTSTTKISGDLDTSGAVDALIKLTEDRACASQLQAAGPLPLGELEKAKGEVTKAIKKAHVELYVGEDDIIRKVAAELEIEPEGKGGKDQVEFELSLGEVNEEQTISAPTNAKPLELLFQKLGVNPIELLQGGSSGGLGGLLEGFEGAIGSSSASSGGSSSGGSAGGGSAAGLAGDVPGVSAKQKEYVECLQGAESASDIQNCASLVK
jgi:hypothetical protein